MRKEKFAILGQLAGTVGHELRNPLGVINNAVYFLKTVTPESDTTLREYLGIIKNEVGNSQRIISDLLDFARTKPSQRSAVPVNELIEQSLEKCSIPGNIEVVRGIPDGLPNLRIDPFQIAQVLQNLVMNAVQAMPEGGTVRISARKGFGDQRSGIRESREVEKDWSLAPDQDFIEISVSDTGEGISPENMKKLFLPLFTTKAKGIGLGLVVCKKLTEANGGKIEVKSEPGSGTVFTVTLPGDTLAVETA